MYIRINYCFGLQVFGTCEGDLKNKKPRVLLSGAALKNFQCFFSKKNLIALITWLQYYKLKLLQPLFSRCENNCFIVHVFLPNKHNQCVAQSCPIKGNFEERAILCLEKLIQISLARAVTICDMHKPNSGFCTSLDTLGELTFDQSFVSKHQIFSFENCRLDNKRRPNVVGTFRKFLEWGAENFSDQSKIQTTCNMAVIDTNQPVFHGKGMTVQYCPAVQCRPT